MGIPQKALPVKLVIGLIANDPALFERAQKFLERRFGPIDQKSRIFAFNQTRYYQSEMGEGLQRVFLSFEKLIRAGGLPAVKIATNRLERRLAPLPSRRNINIDPGYISLAKWVLATTKNHSHRLYIDKGIFEEITLVFCRGSFGPLESTYPDYRQESHIAFFNETRNIYKTQVEKIYGASQLHRCV
ncbi:MAG: DUF4416 family protein [Candidatus Omnitrophica bacterium]|nr:DUF4416 family protein [Candidatus Omnitrophota bacterium]MDD5573859.1 DUF4416 family protein [Candidatus Omnitrophota bacterium]